MSGWMNVVIQSLARKDFDKQEAAAKAIERRKRASLGTYYSSTCYYSSFLRIQRKTKSTQNMESMLGKRIRAKSRVTPIEVETK